MKRQNADGEDTRRPEKAHVVFSTHWDREWIQPFEQYRYRLVNLIDNLLETLHQEPEICFFFDGQTVFLEDYLEIRPEKRLDLERYAKEHRLIVGPWYVLADQFLEGAEATVRNLLIGRKTAREFGGAALVGYVPDSFGSIASLPAILNGFGIRTANFGRGKAHSIKSQGSLFWWQWKDGSRVLALNRGYGNAIGLSYPDIWRDIHKAVPTQQTAQASAYAILQTERDDTPIPLFYLSAGIDHMEMRRGMAKIVQSLNTGQTQTQFSVSNPQQYFEAVQAYIEQNGSQLEVVEGEMRGDVDSPMDLQGVLSTNQDVKRANRRCEALLTGIVEPLSAITRILAGVSNEHFVEHAWKTLLKNHPHDSICACSVDSVIADVMTRFRNVFELTEIMAEQMLRQLVSSRSDSPDTAAPSVTLYNPTAERHISEFDVRVRLPGRLLYEDYALVTKNEEIIGEARRVAVKNIDLESIYATNTALGNMLSKQSPPERDPRDSYTILDIHGVYDFGHAIGFHVLKLIPDHESRLRDEAGMALTGNCISNGLISLTAASDGTLELKDLVQDRAYPCLAWFEDTADLGDTYDYVPLVDDTPLTTVGKDVISIVTRHISPERAEMEITTEMPIPADSSLRGRSPGIQHTIVTVFQVITGSTCVRVRTRYVNHSIQHRLRVAFSFGANLCAFTGGHFAAIEREWICPSEQYPCRPFTDYIHLAPSERDSTDGHFGIFTRGLYECELRAADHDRHVYITLCRSVSMVGKAAGANYSVTHAQELGEHTAEFAFGPTESLSRTIHQAAAYVVPVVGEAHFIGTDHSSVLSQIAAVLPSDVVLTCLKRAVNNEATIVRIFNPYPVETPVKLIYSLPFSSAGRVDLSESELQDEDMRMGSAVTREGSALRFFIGPHGTVTLRLDD